MHVIPVVKTNKDDTTRISTGEKRVNVCAAVNLEKHVFNRSYNEMLFVGKINRNQNNRFFFGQICSIQSSAKHIISKSHLMVYNVFNILCLQYRNNLVVGYFSTDITFCCDNRLFSLQLSVKQLYRGIKRMRVKHRTAPVVEPCSPRSAGWKLTGYEVTTELNRCKTFMSSTLINM